MSVIMQLGFSGTSQPIDHPRVCFDAPAATGTAQNSASGYDPDWVTDGETWNYWRAGSSTSSLTITFPSTEVISYTALAAHNLGATGAIIAIQISTDGTNFSSMSGVSAHAPLDDSAIVWLFRPTAVRAVRFGFINKVAEIAVAQAGMALEFPQRSVFTGLPISESRNVRYRHQQSITGNVLGRAVEGAELEFDLTINNLPETFREAFGSITWKGLLSHIDSGRPFFLAAKPSKYPDDVAYVQALERPRFERQTPNLLLSGSTTFSCKGYSVP